MNWAEIQVVRACIEKEAAIAVRVALGKQIAIGRWMRTVPLGRQTAEGSSLPGFLSMLALR